MNLSGTQFSNETGINDESKQKILFDFNICLTYNYRRLRLATLSLYI